MNGQRGQLSTLIGRTLLGLAATAVTAVLLAPTVAASPMGDAEDAMMAAWEKAGGDTSTLGVRKGDVYPIGDGFALDFAGGKMFFTPATGAKYLYGPLLDKYESLGGAADSDLGLPTINEVPGLAGPDSRVSTFSAADNPVIFWTPEHGAFVVRGALNAAWDKLGSSGGVLGAPVGDETYDGEVTAQKFSGGEVSWNRATKEFTTVPAVLAEQLKGLQVAIDPSAAINMAWRAAGGAAGPLGAKKGGQYPIGGDGIAQDFVGGKVFFSPATGANAVEGEILAKYESLGGPVSSDLGFPIANETDGGFGPSSRIVRFSAADKPVIFWTPDHGAFVVRGAMVAAWDKLRGPNGKLGAPVGDQTVDGDVVSQKFTGGMISWNRAKNTFTTDPANLAPLLSGLQVSGQNQPSTSAMPPPGKKFTWHWWWLGAAALGVLLVVMVALVVFGLRRRRRGYDAAAYDDDRAGDVEYGTAADGDWPPDEDFGSEHFGFGDQFPPEPVAPDAGSTPRVSWPRGAGAAVGDAEHLPGEEGYGSDLLSGPSNVGVEEEDTDAVDTTPTPVVSQADLSEVGPDLIVPERVVPETFVPQAFVPEAVAPEAVPPDVHAADLADTGLPAAAVSAAEDRGGRHAAAEPPEPPSAGVRPAIHLPLEDPYQMPNGYPVKASVSFGLYYPPGSALYHDTLAELWFASEEVAQVNGFIRAD
ncbi:alanine and glycine rich transmembrane protein [Mycobacterium tuberculosis GM 1503]|uniref:LGFP repeat-containing protein n=1 Tax=Mycobacterium tuberculosis TaxID=1773 RepID=UPI0001BC767B|nr:LGFP repeat-containing protein [Mycobacterium tuberculosis]EFD14422.1 conserved alanine and glycine rich membrane protein [Mycobacterium tuberculosis T46]KBF81757.1 alanine and glycine rich transmembrane protein [Mycobacterium tuberculosis GM 1503]